MTTSVAFVGLGRIAGAHLNGLRSFNENRNNEELRLTKVVDLYPGRAEHWLGEHFNVSSSSPEIVAHHEDLLETDHRPDVVSILLPHHLHLEVARPFLEAGVAVQLQKPIGLGLRDSRELIELALNTGTPMVVSEPSVLGRQTRLELNWLRSGSELGQPTLMIDQAVIDLGGGFFMTPWRHLKGMAGAGWFIDHGVHRTHWMLETFGACEEVYARTRQVEPVRKNDQWGEVAVDTEDLAVAMLQFESGVLVQWTVMSGGRGERHGHVQIWGTKGSYRGGKFCPSGQKEAIFPSLNESAVADDVPEDPFAHSFAELIKMREDPSVPVIGDPSRAMEAEAIVYACLESAHTGYPVRVEDVLSGRCDEYERTVWEEARKARNRKLVDLC